MLSTIPLEWWRRIAPAGGTSQGEQASGRVAFAALVVYTVMLFGSPQRYFPMLGGVRIGLPVALVAVAANLLDLLRGRGPARTPVEFKLALTLLALAVATIPLSMWPGGSFQTLTEGYAKSLSMFWVLGSAGSTLRRLRIFFWACALCSGQIALSTLAAFQTRGDAQDRLAVKAAGPMSGIASNPNDIALVLGLFLPLVVTLGLTARRSSARAFAWVVSALSVAGVILTFSRGGFLLLLVEAVMLVAFLWGRRRRRAVAALMLGAIVTAAYLPPQLSERFSRARGDEADPSAQLRTVDQEIALRYILSHPIVGAGLGADTLAMDQLRSAAAWQHLHNVYLAYGVDLGLVGLIVFLALFVSSYRSAARVERSRSPGHTELATLAGGLRISLGGFALAGFFWPVAYHFHFYYLAGLAVAMKQVHAGQQESNVRS